MAKHTDYFKLFKDQMAICSEASQLLKEMVSQYSPSSSASYHEQMHEIENKSDELTYEIISSLFQEFITPIDQEDLLRLARSIDDIVDALDETVNDLYMYHIEAAPRFAPALVDAIDECVRILALAVDELPNFKKPARLREFLRDVSRSETAGDEVYVSAIYHLFETNDMSPAHFIGIKGVYDSLEMCCDMCEEASQVIEEIVMKNA